MAQSFTHCSKFMVLVTDKMRYGDLSSSKSTEILLKYARSCKYLTPVQSSYTPFRL